MRERLYAEKVLIGTRRDPRGRPAGQPYPGPIRDAEAFVRSIFDNQLQAWGMYLTNEEYTDSIQDLIEVALRLEKGYKPERSPSFAGYARHILHRRVTDVGPRQWLGRHGQRINQRSHEQLDTPATERRPELLALTPLESDQDHDRGRDAERLQRQRNSDTTWAHTILGLREAA